MKTSTAEEQALQAAPSAPAEEPKATTKPNTAPRKPRAAPAKAKASKKATPAKKAAKPPKAAKTPKAEGKAATPKTKVARDGSKTAQVVAMLQRKNGATLAEIMDKMEWLPHTVRGFMAGAMKKAGHKVESFKPEGGERTYRLSQ